MDVTGRPDIFEALGMPKVVLKLGNVCPVPVESCRCLALGSWLGNKGAVEMAGVTKEVEEMAL